MEETPSSPRNSHRFLCSYGGRILPRPSDGLLRYVGGETRALSVPRSISFKELKEKIAGLIDAELVVKYQLMNEDLDALVTVKTDEDFGYMIDEYDRLERNPRSPTVACSPRFRLFLFPYPVGEPSLDQRYVNDINGEQLAQNQHLRPLFSGGGMHRVRSTPNFVDGGSRMVSPRAYERPEGCIGYGGGSGWIMGGCGRFQREVGHGCVCNWRNYCVRTPIGPETNREMPRPPKADALGDASFRDWPLDSPDVRTQ